MVPVAMYVFGVQVAYQEASQEVAVAQEVEVAISQEVAKTQEVAISQEDQFFRFLLAHDADMNS